MFHYKRQATKILYPLIITAMLTGFVCGAPTPARAAISEWQQGMTLHLNNQSEADVAASLEQLTRTGVDFVTLSPGYITDSKTSSNVDRKPGTSSDEILIFSIRKAHELGFAVMLKPHVDIKGGNWRAFLRPDDTRLFFENYSRMMLHHADIAGTYGVEQIAVGAELHGLTTNPGNEPYWRKLIADIRSRYSGALTYSANANSQQFDEGQLPFWDALDFVGLSMYIEVADSKSPTVASIMEQWKTVDENYVRPLQQRIGLPLLFTEIGYRSIDGAGMQPEDYRHIAPVDLQEQADLYTAFFEYWKDTQYMYGVHFWEWEPDIYAGGSGDTNYTPQNKPAENVLAQYFGGNAAPADPLVVAPIVGPAIPSPALITEVTAGDAHGVYWLELGKRVYLDRSYEITSFPDMLSGSEYIRTRNDHKWETSGEFISFRLTQDAFVYVAFDIRAKQLPQWLNGWEATESFVKTSDTDFRLYRKYFAQGPVVFGGNAVAPMNGARSMYFVLATPLPEGPTRPAEPEQEITPPEANQPVNPDLVPVETSPQAPAPTPPSTQSGTITGKIVLEYPEHNSIVSGEKKIKISIPDAETDQYTASYSVDGREEKPMDYGSHEKYQQVKIDFEKDWTWNGNGPYVVAVTARDTEGNHIDTKTFMLYIER